jgi:hypothetical protein
MATILRREEGGGGQGQRTDDRGQGRGRRVGISRKTGNIRKNRMGSNIQQNNIQCSSESGQGIEEGLGLFGGEDAADCS